MKKTHKLLILLALVCTLLVCGMMSASAETLGIFTYTITDGEATITGIDADFNGYTSIPETVSKNSVNYPVTAVADSAFSKCKYLAGIYIPASIKSIGADAFKGCIYLYKIQVDSNNQYYSSDSDGVLFNKDKTILIKYPVGNSRSSYSIPNGVTNIGPGAFYDSSYYKGLESITIPKSVTVISIGAFENCTGITSIAIPDNVTTIGSYAFRGCFNLKSVTLGNSVANIYSGAFSGCESLTSINIPDSVSDISWEVFKDCKNLTSINFSENVTRIRGNAFDGCIGLKSITIPGSVTSVESEAFLNCTGLTSITVDADNEYYSSDEFGVLFNKDKTTLIQYPAASGIKSYIIPDSVTSIEEYAFNECTNLESLTIPESVTSISVYAFNRCTLKKLSIPVILINKSIYFGNSAFEEITITSSVKRSMGNFAIYDYYSNYYGNTPWKKHGSKNLKVIISENITSIGSYAFRYCKGLKSITIPYGVTTIGRNAFEGCTGLESITIPGSVTSVGNEAFYNCTGLTTIKINYTTSVKTDSFKGCTGVKTVHFGGRNQEWTMYYEDQIALNDYVDYFKRIFYDGPIEDHVHELYTSVDSENYKRRCCETWVEVKICYCEYSEVVGEREPIGHSEKIIEAVAPTCTKTGLTEGKKCTICNSILVAQQTVPAKGHSFTNYVSNNDATCKDDGTKTARCDNCYYSKDTITDAGTKKAHTDNNHDGRCDNCYTDTTVGCGHMCHKNGGKGTGWYRFCLFFWKLFKMNRECSCGMYHF